MHGNIYINNHGRREKEGGRAGTTSCNIKHNYSHVYTQFGGEGEAVPMNIYAGKVHGGDFLMLCAAVHADS